ncbi:MAG: rRNA maturation RNase YbeY [Arsenophonus sp.]|nr:MAG: rRNA maturation RNase YbeY [Arsenophonus sp.]
MSLKNQKRNYFTNTNKYKKIQKKKKHCHPSVILDLQIACNDNTGLPSKHLLQNWLEAFLPNFQYKSEITIRIVDILESQNLNFKYRGKNKATNILSFPFESPKNIFLPLLGDLIICRQIIEKETFEQKKTINAHWLHIIIHGCLHLLSYNHINKSEAKKMETLEINIMNKLGYPNPYKIKNK